jgi:hypothetical protein
MIVNEKGLVTAIVSNPVAYGDLYQSVEGTQKIKNTPELIEFDSTGLSVNVIDSLIDHSIAVSESGDYNVVYSGSVKIKKDIVYTVYLYKNGAHYRTIGLMQSADDKNYPCFAFSIMLSLVATDYVQIYAECDNAMDKDYKIMSGTSLEVFKLN